MISPLDKTDNKSLSDAVKRKYPTWKINNVILLVFRETYLFEFFIHEIEFRQTFVSPLCQ